jgi:hypothetical protein
MKTVDVMSYFCLFRKSEKGIYEIKGLYRIILYLIFTIDRYMKNFVKTNQNEKRILQIIEPNFIWLDIFIFDVLH